MPAAARPSGPEMEYRGCVAPGEGRARAGRGSGVNAPLPRTTLALEPPFGWYERTGRFSPIVLKKSKIVISSVGGYIFRIVFVYFFGFDFESNWLFSDFWGLFQHNPPFAVIDRAWPHEFSRCAKIALSRDQDLFRQTEPPLASAVLNHRVHALIKLRCCLLGNSQLVEV